MALGNFICKPPRSFGKVKRAVDAFGDICQVSLIASDKGGRELSELYLRPDYHRSQEGQERAKSTIDQSETILNREVPVFAQKTSHLYDSVHYVSSLGSAIQPHVVSNAQREGTSMILHSASSKKASIHTNSGRARIYCLSQSLGPDLLSNIFFDIFVLLAETQGFDDFALGLEPLLDWQAKFVLQSAHQFHKLFFQH